MPKRHLTIQNKGHDHEQQSSTVITRSASKRVNTNESIPTKKSKIEDEYVDKENVPKRQARQAIKPKIPEPVPPTVNVKIVEPEPEQHLKPIDDDEDDDDEAEEEEYPVSSTTNDDDDDGKDHPTNKQYVIYENVGKEPFIISKTARYWNMKYRKVLLHVNPDFYGIYVHNDFSCYGELEVIENCLLDLTKAIFVVQQGLLARFNYTRKPENKINYVLAFRRLEALTILLDYTDGISGIDDGDRFYDIMRVIGACYVTILRGLLPKFMFGKIGKVNEDFGKKLKKISKQIPNFKQVLERALTIGHMFLTIADVCTGYTSILQIVYCNWVLIMENISIDLNKKSNDKVWEALKHASEIDVNDIDHGSKETFDFMNELRLYKEQYPMGGDSHDISKWSKAERAKYSFDRYNDFGF